MARPQGAGSLVIPTAGRVPTPVFGLRRAGARLRRLHGEAAHIRRLVKGTGSLEGCLSRIRRRLANRTEAFLEVVESAIFANPASPYRALLEAAGYDLTSVRMLVGQLGVEGALRRLAQDGVYVAIEEFKGTRDARRGDRTFRFAPGDFDNPLVRGGLKAASGGTRSARIPTMISVEDHRMGVDHLAAALHAYGLSGRPAAVWVAHSHGASLWAVSALTALGAPALQWFTLLGERRRFHAYLAALSRVYGVTLPRLTFVPFNDAARVLSWVAAVRIRAGCGILTMPSLALRLALEAKTRRTSLENVTFVTIGEPLTPTKLRAIQDVGGRAFSSLGFTEFGRATYGCASAGAPDEMHVCRDSIAVVQRTRAVDHLGTEVAALLFTALRPYARKILLNMETGDYAAMTERACGCFLESLGWTEHLQDVRSFEKLNAVGRLFFGSALHSLVEETLPQRFGGEPTDYQLLEEEDAEGFTRLTVLVHPRLSGVEEQAVLQAVEETLQGLSLAHSAVWQEACVVRVRRGAPLLTAAGKLMPLHHLAVSRHA